MDPELKGIQGMMREGAFRDPDLESKIQVLSSPEQLPNAIASNNS